MFGLKPVLGYSLWFTFKTWKGNFFAPQLTITSSACRVSRSDAHISHTPTFNALPDRDSAACVLIRATYRMLLVASPRCNLNQLDANDLQWLVLAVSFIAEE